MSEIEALRHGIIDPLRDIKLNLESVLGTGAGALSNDQRWGVLVASAAAARHPALSRALRKAAAEAVSPQVIEDALAAAGLMAMNNVYYRFRHMVGKPSYSEMPARLRMTRIARPATNKADFELFCLAVSTVNGCEMCLRAHEEVVLNGGLTEAHVHDAARVAATVHAAAVALEISELERELAP